MQAPAGGRAPGHRLRFQIAGRADVRLKSEVLFRRDDPARPFSLNSFRRSNTASGLPAPTSHYIEAETGKLPPAPVGYHLRMPRVVEETRLCVAGKDAFGREVRLAAVAADAWAAMRRESAADGVQLLLLSGFRSVSRQAEIVRKKLEAGGALEEILQSSAYPGHSEHHTGRAVDLGSPDCEHLSAAFENTQEFGWLRDHAVRFGFSLSYPRDNPGGIVYEPWHWMMTIPKPLPTLAATSHLALPAGKGPQHTLD